MRPIRCVGACAGSLTHDQCARESVLGAALRLAHLTPPAGCGAGA